MKNKIIIIIYIILLLLNKYRYYRWYPSINTKLLGYGIEYPDSCKEIKVIMNDYILKRTDDDIKFFRLTDKNIVIAFMSIIDNNEMTEVEMKNIITSSKIINDIYKYKYLYNRARPSQIVPNLINKENGNLLESQTGNTPSYPSGHAYQSYYLGKILSKKYPNKKDKIMNIARRCGDIRIIGGLHYPSDRDFAYWIIDKIYNI